MPKLKIDGVGTVQVDDSFTKLSLADQNAFVAHVVDQTSQGVKTGGGGALPALASPSPSSSMMAPQVSGSGSQVFDDTNVRPLTVTPSSTTPPMSYGDQMRHVFGAIGSGADQAVRAVADGMTFGMADRAAAGADTLFKGGSYGQNLAAERQRTDQAGAALPGLNTALRAAGGLATGAGLARGGLSLAMSLPEAAPMLARLPAFATDAAVAGAADAVGHKDTGTLGSYLDAAGQGATVGAALGAGIPAAAGAVGGTAGFLAPFLSKPLQGVGRLTTGLLSQLVTPRAAETVAKLGPEAALADASPSLLGLAQGVASRPGAGADNIVDFVNARHAGQSDRLVSDLNTNLGPAFSPADITGQLDAKRAGLLPVMAQADASTLPWTSDLAALSERPAMKTALRTAGDTAANEGRPLPMVSLNEQGRDIAPAARQAYEGYSANAGQHVDAALGDLLGSDGALAKADQIVAARKAAADPLYAQFRAGNVPMTDDLVGLLKRPSVKAALPSAERLAQDEGKSIYLNAPGENGTAPIGGDDSRPFTPLEAYDDARVDRPTKPDVPRPQTLQSFVKSLGGVQDPSGDLKAMGLDAIPGLVAKEGKGLGPDAVRQAAAEAGYLGAHIDNAMADTSVNDLFDALGNHPHHSVYDEDAVHRWAGYDQVRADYDRSGSRDGGPAGPNVPGFPDPGPNAPPVRQITPEGWDYVKRALDDKISGAKRGGSNNEARVYTSLKNELTGALDDAVPVYAKARQVFAGHSDLSDALDAGQSAAERHTSVEQMRREFGGLKTDGERQMYRLGAANTLRDMVTKRPDGPNLAAPLVNNQATRDKLGILAPSSDALGRFNQRVADTSRSFTEAQRPDMRGLRYALDALDRMRGKATGDQAAAIGQTGDALRAQLGAVPAFARADLGSRAIEGGQAAFDMGRGVLRGGDAQPFPHNLSATMDALPLERQALLRAGARSDIEQRFGQNRNDLSALHRIVGGENDFNRANMGTLFGPEATRMMVEAAEREQAFAATRNAIAAGSRTAPMQAGSKAIDDATAARAYVVPKDATLLGLLGNAAEHGVRKGTGLLAAAANEAVRGDLGGLLSATGPERDRIVTGLLGALTDRARSQAAIRSAIESPAVAPALAALPPRRRRASR